MSGTLFRSRGETLTHHVLRAVVELFSLTGPQHDFHFAQVDCASNGDLCHSHDVKYYPSIFLYEDGKFKEEYVDKRSVEELSRFVEGNWRDKVVQEVVGAANEDANGSNQKARPRPAKGAEKARLPKLHLEEEVGDSAEGDSATTPEVKPYGALLEDASSKVNAFLNPTSSSDPEVGPAFVTTTQTPPSAMSSTTFVASPQTPSAQPRFVAQQPESKRSAEAEGSSITNEWEKTRGIPDGTVKTLSKADAERIKDQDAGPSFVKFFAPW